MYPTLLHFGSIRVSSYGVMLTAAFVVGYLLLYWEVRRRNIDVKFMQRGYGSAIIGAFAGARIHSILLDTAHFFKEPLRVLFAKGGWTFQGALIGGITVAIVYLLIHKRNLLADLDVVAPIIFVGQGIGRMGCLLAGCCHGKATGFFLGACYPAGSEVSYYQFEHGLLQSAQLPSLPVHLTPVYEALFNFAMFFVLVKWLRPRLKYRGSTFALYLIISGVERFLIEFIRINPVGVLGLTDFQWVAMGLTLTGMIVLIFFAKQAKGAEELGL